MRIASVVSATLHGAFLLWAVLSFSSRPFEVTPAESLPVDLVNIEDFQKMTKGAKDAPKKEEPAPLVEKVEPPKPVEEQKPKVEKKEVKTEKESAPPPPQQQPDAIADQIKKMEQPKEAKVEQKPPTPPKKPEKQQPKFDADKIAALLDKRDPTRNAAADIAPSSNSPGLGAARGNDKQLSMTELAAFKERLKQCWNPPVGADPNARLYVVMRVMFNKNGTVMRDPALVEGTASNFGPALADSGRRALLRCQPYTMFKPETYEIWKDIEVKFDLQEMLGG